MNTMFPAKTYSERRQRLCALVGSGNIYLPGNVEVGMNYAANVYHFRQDSTFLYYFGIDRPGLAAVIDADSGKATVYGDELTMDDIVWTGPLPTIAEQAALAGVTATAPASALAGALQGAQVHYLPPYRHANAIRLAEMLGKPLSEIKAGASIPLIKAVVSQRSIKTAEEVVQLEQAVRLTNEMHLTAMRTARPGGTEAEVHAAIQEVVYRHDSHLSFPVIVSVRGEILHNHHHGNTLEDGQLLLCDCGGESAMHYAGDMTRTFPVNGRFSARQKEVYEVCLQAEVEAAAALRPGITYRDVHLQAARVIASGLKDIGLMKGDVDEAVAAGAHALFFPHGLGHMMGLDVHDMEDLGEQYVGYSDSMSKSKQFGLGFLRLGRELETGFVLTVEPGIYFIPDLIQMWKAEGKFTEFVNYDALDSYLDFGGIRIEEDFLITESGGHLLGDEVPKTVAAIEELMQG